MQSLAGDTGVASSYFKRDGTRNKPYLIYFPSTQKNSRIFKSNNELLHNSHVIIKHNINSHKF